MKHEFNKSSSPWPWRPRSAPPRMGAAYGTGLAGKSPRHLRHRRLPQPYDLLRRLDLDAEAGQEVDRQAGHALGPRLVRAGRPRRQRQPQLHAGRRRDARDAGLSAGVQAGRHAPTRDRVAEQHQLAEHASASRHSERPLSRAIRAVPRTCGAGSRSRNIQYPLLEYLSALKSKPLFIGARIGRRRPRAHLDVGHHRPDAVFDLQAEAADQPGLLRRSATRPR